ncbi:hypothetical protein HanHA300_Chr04g0140131 [Helianthus annuus]|nr:hypothetical protein HanHA300_Chr04g0140131 [Helianthus annuus]KAJ0589300.1 hypothetical protein HanIR_Chr04g0184591 [Helianthus annuus]KAJ0597307.1 hypothetical protein HanHA89_Chr04g0153091 [Helianthus annuus]
MLKKMTITQLLLINQYSYLVMASGAGGKVSFKVIAPLIPSCQSKCPLSPPEGAPLVLLLNLLLNNSKFLNKLVLPPPTVFIAHACEVVSTVYGVTKRVFYFWNYISHVLILYYVRLLHSKGNVKLTTVDRDKQGI